MTTKKLRPIFNFTSTGLYVPEVNRTEGVLAAYSYLAMKKRREDTYPLVIFLSAIGVGVVLVGIRIFS